MRGRGGLASLAGLAATLALGGCAGSGGAATPTPPPGSTHRPSSGGTTAVPSDGGTPTASSAVSAGVSSFPTVGLVSSAAGRRCTGSVVASSTGDTVLTAAHCATGDATQLRFTPGYVDGHAPDGVWQVTGAYVSPQWQHGERKDADVAVLAVAPRTVDGRLETLADAVGSETVGRSPATDELVTAVAYVSGDDTPRACRAPVYVDRGAPTFNCHGFSGGSSGSPWLTGPATDPTVRGVIGGLDLGGCHEYTSHTTPFTTDVDDLVARADAGGASDQVRSLSSTC